MEFGLALGLELSVQHDIETRTFVLVLDECLKNAFEHTHTTHASQCNCQLERVCVRVCVCQSHYPKTKS